MKAIKRAWHLCPPKTASLEHYTKIERKFFSFIYKFSVNGCHYCGLISTEKFLPDHITKATSYQKGSEVICIQGSLIKKQK